jgi:hypothetical protein
VELQEHEFASAPVITPRNECRNAIIKQRVLEYAREHAMRAVRYRATDYVRTEARMQDDPPSVWSAFEGSRAGSGDLAVAELADFYGMKGGKNDGDNSCAKVRSLWSCVTLRVLC